MKTTNYGKLAVVVLLLSVSSAFARPHWFRGWRRGYEPGEFLAAAPAAADQPKKDAAASTESIDPPKGHVLLFEFRAEGVQIYECKPKKSEPMEYEWAVKPDATLFDDRGEKAGTHYAGPSWEAKDGSKVVAAKKAGRDAPGGRAVPWLLLEAKLHEGTGAFSKVTFIQRVDTWAGLPPTEAATKEKAGKEVRVKYEATYRFYGMAP